MEKLAYLHLELAKDVRNMMKDVTGDDGPDEWIALSAEEFDKVATSVSEDLIKPTSNLSDMMYKSVEIRDSRLGLQLDASMWRLSWITFIFLPLTFISGFFGMNVDVFSKDEDNPELKWYFIVTVPLMLCVVLFWLLFKRAGPGLDNDPTDSQRGVYEHLFHEFSDNYPHVWAREGPRPPHPNSAIHSNSTSGGASVFKRLKWRLVRHWFNPATTIRARGYDPADDLGPYARFKRHMARRWLRELETDARTREVREGDQVAALSSSLSPSPVPPGRNFDLGPAMEAGEGPLVDARERSESRGSESPKLSPAQELAFLATQAVAEAEPGAVPPIRRMRSEGSEGSHARSGSGGVDGTASRPGSSSGLVGAAMVEVEMGDVGSGSGRGSEEGEDEGGGGGKRRGRGRGMRGDGGGGVDRLHVPFKPGRAGEHAP